MALKGTPVKVNETGMNILERSSCVFLLGLSVLIGLMSIRLGVGGIELMGAGFMPLLASILLFVLTFIVFVQGLGKTKKTDGEVRNKLRREELAKPLMLVGGLIVYAFFLMSFGYLIMTFLFVFFLFFMMQPKKWRMDLLFAALVSILSFILFDTLLSVRLPAGILTMIR